MKTPWYVAHMRQMNRKRSDGWVRAAVLFGVAIAVSLVACIDSAGLSDAKCIATCNHVCVDTQRDALNCGGCGKACAAGQACTAGVCGASKGCADTTADPSNCGACGNVCPARATCAAGACKCADPTTMCGGGDSGASAAAICTDLKTDAANCGTCGHSCQPGLACIDGACVVSAVQKNLELIAGQVGSAGNLDGTGPAARFDDPWGVCQTGTDLYVVDQGNCVIRKVVLASGETSTFAGTKGSCATSDGVGAAARFENASTCALDGSGHLFITDRCSIRQVDLTTATVTTIAGNAGEDCTYADGTGKDARFNFPQGIAWDGSANLYIGDSGNHAIRKVAIPGGVVTTLAGAAPPTAASGSTDDVGAAARFNGPQAIYVDAAAGFLYVADYSNHAIRRVTLADGTTKTVVGGGPQNAGGTDGLGTDARLKNPIGVAYDGNGNLYVTEDGNHDIRVVALSNFNVSTNAGASGTSGFADGTKTSALFANPRAVTFDGAGNYYVGDYNNHVIRKVVAATGTVTTIAGLGATIGSTDGAGAAATFTTPYGLAFDGNDTLYLSDADANTIRAITLSTKTVKTVAGTAGVGGAVDGTGTSAKFSYPTGIAFDNGNLYVADRYNHTIRQVVVATGAVTTIAGNPGNQGYQEGPTGSGGGALFNQPVAVAVAAGKLYVADLGNHVIRLVPLSGGTPTTLIAGAPSIADIADGAPAHFSNISGLVVTGGTIFVSDTNRLRSVDIASGRVLTVSGGGGYSDGQGAYANFNFNGAPGLMSLAADGSMLLADTYNAAIRKFVPATHVASTLAGIYGIYGAVIGPVPASIASNPRSAVEIPSGIAFVANRGVFAVR
jgi:hypothetical protein